MWNSLHNLKVCLSLIVKKLELIEHITTIIWVMYYGVLLRFCTPTDPTLSPAKGRTNIELREQFILAEGVSQSMSAFKPKPSPSSQRSVSVSSGSAGPITKVSILSLYTHPHTHTLTYWVIQTWEMRIC